MPIMQPFSPPSAPKHNGFLLLLACTWLLAACARSKGPNAPLRVAVAASLQRVGQELASAFHEQEGTPVQINCAGSNVLAKQIEAAGQTDVLLSADAEWVSYLAQKNRIWQNHCSTFLSNRLVLVAHPSRGRGSAQLCDLAQLEFEHLALANPAGVPAGRYAKRLLESVQLSSGSLYDALEAKLVPCLDVRAALALAETQPEVLALVYASEAKRSQVLLTFIQIPESMQPPIAYRAALVRDRDHPDQPRPAALRFLSFLNSARAQAIYRSNGFQPMPNPVLAPQ